jgi:hypothetical protein
MTPEEIDWLLVYLLVLMLLVEVSAGVVAMCAATLGRKNSGSRRTCRRALTIVVLAAAAGSVLYVILCVRTGLIDLSGPPPGRLAIVETGKPSTARLFGSVELFTPPTTFSFAIP